MDVIEWNGAGWYAPTEDDNGITYHRHDIVRDAIPELGILAWIDDPKDIGAQ